MTHEGLLTMEQESQGETYRPIFIGRLSDLGLGSPDGIPSRLAEASSEEIADYADTLIAQLESPTTLDSFSCIDGREILPAYDGTEPHVRLRRVGGSAANYGVALNAGMDIDSAEQADVLSLTGRSAHTEGCGGANGEISDNEAVASDPKIMRAAEALLSIPQIAQVFDVNYAADAAEVVAHNAGQTAQQQKAEGWSGQTYVDNVTSENPDSVDSLQGEPGHKFNGHNENALVVIVGDKTLRNGDFVWNLAASKKAIDGFVKNGGDRVRLTIAEVAKHLSVANRLPSDATPVIVLAA